MDFNNIEAAVPSNEQADADAPKPEPSKTLTIRIRDQNHNEMSFKLKPHTKLKKAMDLFAETQQLARRTLRFMIDGARIADESTPEDFEMEDGDLIEVFTEQIGGGW